MNPVFGFRWITISSAPVAQLVLTVISRVDIYRRYVSAGLEVEALLSLTDQQLAERHLTREGVGRRILAKHGIELDR